MKRCKSSTSSDKAKSIVIFLLYPFEMLFNVFGKTAGFFSKQRERIMASLLTAVMLISMIPATDHTASAAEKKSAYFSNPILGTGIDILPVGSVASVYLGQYPQDTADPNNFQPIKWSVVLKNVNELGNLESSDPKTTYFPQHSSGAVTLISEKILDTCDFMDYKSSWTNENYLWHLPYSRSKLHQFLDGAFKIKAFSEAEMEALSDANVLVWGGSYYETLDYATESVNAKVFAPDFYIHGYADMKGLLTINEAAEVTTYAAAQKWSNGYLDKNAYWLRTVPCYYPLIPCDQGISMNGRFQIRDSGAQTRALTVGVRPMTRVLDSNIMLVSQVGAKDSTSVYNDNLTGEKEYEFTLYDSTRNFKATPTGDVIYGEQSATVNLSYTGAKVGANEYISYIVTDEYGRIYKYERLKTVTSPSGTISIEIDYEDFGNNNDCELRVFNEQINSGCYTDYASNYSKVQINRDENYYYPIWIRGKHISADNAKDYGYDPSTNTLTITDPWYVPMNYYEKDGVCYGIYVEGDLNINFYPEWAIADYELVSSGKTGLSQTTIYVSGDLNMTSNLPGRKLYIDNGVTGRMPTMTGIECGGKLTVSNMTLDIDTGNAIGMYAIKAKSIELYNATIIAHTAYDLADRQNASSSLYRSYVISCESYYQMGGSVEIYPINNDYGDHGLELLGEGNFELDGKATLIFDGEVDYHFGWGKTIEEVVANKDISVATEGNKKVLKANSCSKHEISYRASSSKVYEECHYCKEVFGLMRILPPANLYYDGTPKYVRIYGQLPSNPEITITYYNYDTKEYGDPVKIGGYNANYTVGSEKGFIQFKIIENTTGEAPKTDFEKLQEQINAGGSIWVGYVAAESTDKPLIIPENVEVNLLLAESVIDRSEALEPGPVFDVRGTLKLVGHSIVNSNISSVISGGTDSGIIVRPGGTLILANIYNFEITGNTSNGPGAGIYCAGTIIEEGDPRIYGNMSNGKESGIHLADSGQLIYKDHLYGVLGDFEDLKNTVAITRDNMSKPIAVAGEASASIIENIAKRHVSGYDHMTTYFNKATGELYLIPKGMTYTPGTYKDHYTDKESGKKEYVKRSDFNNQSTLDLVSTSKEGSFGYIQVKEGSSNKNVQLSFTTFAISMVVPANTTYEVKHDFLLKMDRNSSGSLGYYSEIFYFGDDPDRDLTFVRGDTSDQSEGSSGKAYSESKNGYTKTISVTATYKNDSNKDETITQWFGFYAGLGKASTYNHQAEFTMELARPGFVMSATDSHVTHSYSDDYFSDNEKHWRVCSICGSEEAPEGHVYDDDRDDTCNICDYVRDVSCKEHVYDNDCDIDCNVCGEERTVTHDWQEDWSSDGEKHWHECSVCGARNDEGTHTPEMDDGDCTTAVYCTVCGAEITPAQSHDFSDDWLHDEDGHWHKCTHSGCIVTDNKQDHEWTEGEPSPAPTYFADGQRIDSCACGETRTVVLQKLTDNIVPTGDITISETSVKKLLNAITFGLFFKDTQEVTITSADSESGVKSTQYYLSTEILDENAIKNISSWKNYEGSISLNPNDRYVVYVKITDNQNNVAYLGSDGITIDNVAPKISGIESGKSYCISAEFTVTEENLDTVKVNGTAINPIDGKYTLTASGENEVVVTDKSGNAVAIAVTINAAHTYDNDSDADCNVCGAERTIAHVHSWRTEWSSDGTNHWHECSVCHERKDEAGHIYDHDCDTDCNVCGAERTISHNWQSEWSSDGEKHWHECSACQERKDEAVHIYDNDLDAECNVCGTERTIGHTHDWQEDWSSDGNSHWHECSICHEKKDEAAHTPEIDDNDCTTAVLCSVCGAVTTPAQAHDFSGALLYDADGHWHQCTHSGCTATDSKQNHDWIEGEPNPAPTYSEDGQRIDTCACGETKIVVLPKLIDSIAPAVTLSSSAANTTSISPIPVTITFSKEVTGFGVEDITVTNGEKSNFAALSATVYTVDITPSTQGTVTVNVAAGVATDMAGNGNTAAAQLSITYTIKSYKVKFLDYDGKELKIETVYHGSGATAPVSPTREGYTFTNWDKAFDNVTEDLTVTAVYRKNNPSSGGGGGPSVTPQPQSATVIGSVVNGNTGSQVSDIEAKVTTNSNGSSTITMNASQAVVLKEPDGSTSKLADMSKITIAMDTGSQVPISTDGTIKVENLKKGTENSLEITYDLGNGQKITIGRMNIKIDEKGNANITVALVDPYGIITDSATGKAVKGVKMTLYYADTERNRVSGKTPGDEVSLPLIDGFKPNNNKNPQISDAAGAYGFMVFPNSDYYVVGEKEGYNKYISPTISVEEEIVKWDFKMHQTGAERLYGKNRVDTSIEIAKTMYANNIPNVIIATAENYPDALTGSVLANKLNAPILLVGRSEEGQLSILSYIKEYMNPEGTVYILGGTGSVSGDFETKIIEAGFKNIDRIDGKDRYETSVKTAKKIGIKSGTPIVLVSGENYPDALSVSSIAAINQYPILLTGRNGIPDSVKMEILKINPSKIYIIGLQGAVGTEVEEEAAKMTNLDKSNIIRIGGTNRYETSLEIAKYFDLSEDTICAATGNNFADALAGSLYAARKNAPIILVDKTLSDDQIAYLKNMGLINAVIFGGEAAVSRDIMEELSKLLKR